VPVETPPVRAADLFALTEAELLDLLVRAKIVQAEEFGYARGGEVAGRAATVEDARHRARRALAEANVPDPEVIRFVLHQRLGIKTAVAE
jgi:hypothetical protein